MSATNAVMIKAHRYIRTDGTAGVLPLASDVLVTVGSPSSSLTTIVPVGRDGALDYASAAAVPRGFGARLFTLKADTVVVGWAPVAGETGGESDAAGNGNDNIWSDGGEVSEGNVAADTERDASDGAGGAGGGEGESEGEGEGDSAEGDAEGDLGGNGGVEPPPKEMSADTGGEGGEGDADEDTSDDDDDGESEPPPPDEPAERLMTRLAKTQAFNGGVTNATNKLIRKAVKDAVKAEAKAGGDEPMLAGGDKPLSERQKETTELVAKTLADSYKKASAVSNDADAARAALDKVLKASADATKKITDSATVAANDAKRTIDAAVSEAVRKSINVDVVSSGNPVIDVSMTTVALSALVSTLQKVATDYERANPSIVDKLVRMITENGIRTFCLTGPSGCGKSTSMPKLHKALEEAKVLGDGGPLAYEAIQCYRNAPETLFTGINQYNITDGTVSLKQSRFAAALAKPSLLLVDEVDNADRSGIMVLNNAVNHGGFLVQEDNTIVHRHDDNVTGFTANTFGDGATSTYSGRTDLDGAFRNRIELWVPCTYDLAAEFRIIFGHKKPTEYASAEAVRRAQTLHVLWTARAVSEKNDLGRIVGTRNIITAEKMLRSVTYTAKEVAMMVLADWPQDELALVKVS